jgi:TonB family protein
VIRFEIGSDGAVSGVRVVQASGNAAYDASALRAVQLASPLPPPPTRYAEQFREFQMEFHSEDQGGQGAG